MNDEIFTLPSMDINRVRIPKPPPLYTDLDAALYDICGIWQRAVINRRPNLDDAKKIHKEADAWRTFSDRRLKRAIADVSEKFRSIHTPGDRVIASAMSLLVEAAHRTMGLRPFPVQIMGSLGLYRNLLVEMATGEGKSLTAAICAVLRGWTGRPLHIITVNDYLAERDALLFSRFYEFCGLTSGFVTGPMEPTDRRQNYAKNVTYTTSKEILADFLRDRLSLGRLADTTRRLIHRILSPNRKNDGTVMSGINTAIVDEADSVLIDEAVTPLIIAAPAENSPLIDAVKTAHRIAAPLVSGKDYRVDTTYRTVRLTQKGTETVTQASHLLSGIWQAESRRNELVEQVLTAREFYHLSKQYVVVDGKVVIVDEFTGRMMPNRSWSHGLHQAVEAKEGIEITPPTETLARLSFQRFFRLFTNLSGMTGTAWEGRREFWSIYGLAVLRVPTNRPCVRKVSPDRIFPDISSKWDAVVRETEDIHATGRPILVGTRNVEASEYLADRLRQKTLDVQVLNAVRHKEEAQIIAGAGKPGKITIATNMAGRGTDIKLSPGVAEAGGLHVIATERHESHRIDRQLFGRCARQGDPGSAVAFLSMGDDLLKRFLPSPARRLISASLSGKHSSIARSAALAACRIAQVRAQWLAYRLRKQVLKSDTWLEESLPMDFKTGL